ncbi:MAG: M50 family metallopeptidase [Planctomycetota bacterium]
MFGHRIKLFSLAGFPVRIDLSWLFIFVLITWSLAEGVFPAFVEDASRGTYWLMGVLGALTLFASIVLHEVGHALVARRMGTPMKGITLFIFGGIAEMGEEPTSPRGELLMAVAGPAVSVMLGLGFLGASQLALPETARAVLGYLAVINLVLVAFNLVPAFPLDGGRVLRSLLWRWKGNLRWATRVASQVGSGFGAALWVLALFRLLSGNLVGAIWLFVLGLFVRGSAKAAYQRVIWRQLLADTSVRRLMSSNPATVSPDVPLDDFVENYLYHYHYQLFPVAQDGTLLGCVTTDEVRDVPREQWGDHTVGDVFEPCSEETAIDQDADAVAALKRMRDTGKSRLLAVDGDQLAGVITLKDLSNYITRRVELEEDPFAST